MKKFVFIMPFMAIALLANCGGKTYHVTFTNEGEKVSEKDYKENEEIVAPENPVKPDGDHKVYTFDGWYDSEVKYEKGMKATRDYNFVAAFNVDDVYDMNFYESSGTKINTISVLSSNPTLTFPEHEVTPGHVGKWWCETLSTSYSPKQTKKNISGNLDFKWLEVESSETHEISFYVGDTTEPPFKTLTVLKQDAFFEFPEEPNSKPNYKWYNEDLEEFFAEDSKFEFDEWYPVDDYDFVWKEQKYTMSFYDSEGAVEPFKTIIVGGDDLTLVFPEGPDSKDNYKWFWDDEQKYFAVNDKIDLTDYYLQDYDFVWKEVEQHSIKFYNDETKQSEYTTITLKGDYPILTFPQHEIGQTGYVGKWKCITEGFDLEGQYFVPNQKEDFTWYLSDLRGLSSLDFVWEELNARKVEFEDEGGQKLPDLTIDITQDDFSITLPDGLETKSGWCGFWSYDNGFSVDYYKPEDTFYLDILEFHNYVIKWKTFEIKEYTMNFYNDETKESLFTSIPVTTDNPSVTLPKDSTHVAGEGVWKYQVVPGYPADSASPGSTITFPPDVLGNFDFVWVPNE